MKTRSVNIQDAKPGKLLDTSNAVEVTYVIPQTQRVADVAMFALYPPRANRSTFHGAHSMTNPHETKGPSEAELQRHIREKVKLEFILTTGKSEHGTLKWFDEHAFSLQQESGSLTILRAGVIAYKIDAK